ncbi:hypothetical protein MPH_03993 [Macrophomina phaseolina MS6]|uniref:Uncharacterized protein n=1 Tax=Macrophomina phaseolina (strain MS6) TaxID=1126212 RepID=K2S1C2_MACPH|nr:hypothetical protein MPH_03993 [Macrophomina phaseolina MS6]
MGYTALTDGDGHLVFPAVGQHLRTGQPRSGAKRWKPSDTIAQRQRGVLWKSDIALQRSPGGLAVHFSAEDRSLCLSLYVRRAQLTRGRGRPVLNGQGHFRRQRRGLVCDNGRTFHGGEADNDGFRLSAQDTENRGGQQRRSDRPGGRMYRATG